MLGLGRFIVGILLDLWQTEWLAPSHSCPIRDEPNVLQLVWCSGGDTYWISDILLHIDLTSTAIIPKVPYMSTVLANGEGASSRVDICPPSSSLRGFLYQAQKREVAPYGIHQHAGSNTGAKES